MAPHKYLVKNVLFDDEEEYGSQRSRKYDAHGRLRALQRHQQRALSASLASSESALSVLRETESIGIAANEELHRQGETLKRVDRQLDGMKADLEQSHHRIGSIESVFHSLKRAVTRKSKNKQRTDAGVATTTAVDNRPTPRVYRLNSPTVGKREGDIEKKIEENLEEMVLHVGRLKEIGLAQERVINEQIMLLDAIQLKVDDGDDRMRDQTRRMKKLI